MYHDLLTTALFSIQVTVNLHLPHPEQASAYLKNHDSVPERNDSSLGLYVKEEPWPSSFGSGKFREKDHRRDGRKTMRDRKVNMLKKDVVFFIFNTQMKIVKVYLT